MTVEIQEHRSPKRPLFLDNLALNVYICIKKVELKVLYFGVSRDQTNKDEEDLDVRENLTAGEFKKKLMDLYPKLEDIQSFALAVNETYADDGLMLKEGDTIAIIPPVSGG
jgi:molybdopterin converting factor subunit 1